MNHQDEIDRLNGVILRLMEELKSEKQRSEFYRKEKEAAMEALRKRMKG